MCAAPKGFTAWPARLIRPKACLAASWEGSLSLPGPDRVRIASIEVDVVAVVEATGLLAKR